VNIDKLKVGFLKKLLPRSDWAREELAKVLLPKSPHSIFLGWDDVDMGGKRIERVGAPVADDDVARKADVEAAAMPVGEHGDMIYHDAEKWTALKAPTTEKWLKHPGGATAPVWTDLPPIGAADIKTYRREGAYATVPETVETLKDEATPDSDFTALIPQHIEIGFFNPYDSGANLIARLKLKFSDDTEELVEEWTAPPSVLFEEIAVPAQIAKTYKSGVTVSSLKLYAYCDTVPASGSEPQVALLVAAGMQY